MITQEQRKNGICGFFGEYRFLSNFWLATVIFEGVEYPSVEHAYQAAKTYDIEQRKHFVNITAGQAKKFGKQLELRSDWETVKDRIMHQLVRHKFIKHPELAKKLYDTGNSYLEETNYWNDRYWGVCNGKGKNRLGFILMAVREEINTKIKSV